MPSFIKPLLAELLGAFAFIFVGAGSIILDAHTGGSVGLLGIAIAHGLMLAIVISATMNISGAHINPAVTIGLALIGKHKPALIAPYIIAQLVGSALAGALLMALMPADAASLAKFGSPTPSDALGIGQVIGLEIIGTFFLCFAIYGTAAGSKAPSGLGGFGIGLTVTAVILCIGPLTGAALNPARHFGPALFGGEIGAIWIYWVGPIIGAALAFPLAKCALEPDTK